MELQKTTLETAKLARQKGFDLQVQWTYTSEKGDPDFFDDFKNWNEFEDNYSAPTLELLSKWLREKHNIVVTVNYYLDRTYGGTIFENDEDGNVISTQGMPLISYNSYEKVLESGIKEGLKKIKEIKLTLY